MAITRTPIATPLILAILSGSPQVTVPCVAAAIASLFITLKLPFIKTQRDRDDFHFKEVHLLPPPQCCSNIQCPFGTSSSEITFQLVEGQTVRVFSEFQNTACASSQVSTYTRHDNSDMTIVHNIYSECCICSHLDRSQRQLSHVLLGEQPKVSFKILSLKLMTGW